MPSTRSGGFGTSLRPVGGGTISNLGQYDVGPDLAELAVYETEVKWRNGEATDDEYRAALQKVVDATDPGTHKRIAAVDRLNDADYQIGRSKADKAGLDALIAYDQASITKLNPDNLRYRNIQQSLNAELAQRRSRDYGKLVDAYNAGHGSTDSLLAWVNATVKNLTTDDPDYANWQGVQGDLNERVKGERDADVYQDFQQRRIKPAAFLAYLTARRDGYSKGSPKYEEWTRKLEDAKTQVTNDDQAKKDQAFFNKYQEGHVSDKDYLRYLRTRIGGMKADDPQKPEWVHRLHEAAFSLAEDQLRFAVDHHKAPVSKLIAFYRNYRRTLNPGSAEYRTITRALDALAGFGGGGGGGGGRKKKGSGGGGGKASAAGGFAIPKLIGSKLTLDNVLHLMVIDPNASKKEQAAAKKYFTLNYDSLENARQRGDDVWKFFDPRHPGQMVAALNPDGSPVLDANGKPVMVQGSVYLPTKDQTFAQLSLLKANYHYALADKALAHHDAGGYAFQMKEAINAEDKARLVQAQFVQHSNQDFYDHAKDGIDVALKIGDWATAINLSNEMAARLAGELRNPMLDDTRRDKLNALGEKLADQPLLPKYDPVTGTQTGGAVNLAASTVDSQGNFTNVVLNPGWHKVLDDTSTKTGQPGWGLVFDDRQDGTWEGTHISVHTSYGTNVVTGEVKVSTAPVSPTIIVSTPDGMIQVPDSGAQFISYVDEHGQVVRAYSLDGRTWIRALTGQNAPVIQVGTNVHRVTAVDGSTELQDEDGQTVFTQQGDGTWKANNSYFSANPDARKWFGQAAYESAAAGAYAAANDPNANVHLVGAYRAQQYAAEVGAPGQHMQLADLSDDGLVNFTPPPGDFFKTVYDSSIAGDPLGREGYKQPPIIDSGIATKPGRNTRAASGTTGAARRNIDRDDPDPWTPQLPANTPPRSAGVPVGGGGGRNIDLPTLGRYATIPGIPPPAALAILGPPAPIVLPPPIKIAPPPPIKAKAPPKPPAPKSRNIDRQPAPKPKPVVKATEPAPNSRAGSRRI